MLPPNIRTRESGKVTCEVQDERPLHVARAFLEVLPGAMRLPLRDIACSHFLEVIVDGDCLETAASLMHFVVTPQSEPF